MPFPARFDRRSRAAGLLAATALAVGCSSGAANGPGPSPRGGPLTRIANAAPERFPAAPPARAELRDLDGRVVGTATLTQGAHGLVVDLALTGIAAGAHAMHVHDVGRCEPPFTSAGGHYNPLLRAHGVKAPNGVHAGDLPNVHVTAGGTTRAEVFTRELQLGAGAGTVFDRDGSSLMIHSAADDYASDPAGNAGTRIACGVIVRADSGAARADTTRR